MHEGIAAAKAAFDEFLSGLDWQRNDLNRIFCHQVGRAHRKMLLDRLQLDPELDYATLPWLGNTGSVALPMTASVGVENGQVAAGDRVAFLGIGSGINVLMLGLEWGNA